MEFGLFLMADTVTTEVVRDDHLLYLREKLETLL